MYQFDEGIATYYAVSMLKSGVQPGELNNALTVLEMAYGFGRKDVLDFRWLGRQSLNLDQAARLSYASCNLGLRNESTIAVLDMANKAYSLGVHDESNKMPPNEKRYSLDLERLLNAAIDVGSSYSTH